MQEALTNVQKHADATVVRVSVASGEDLRILVADNGRGFHPDAVDGGFGLDSMRQRADLIGATTVDQLRSRETAAASSWSCRCEERSDRVEGEAPLRVMLVDDHALVRSAIRQALEAPDVEVVGEARNAEEALELAPAAAARHPAARHRPARDDRHRGRSRARAAAARYARS